jgi:hypothetical protein
VISADTKCAHVGVGDTIRIALLPSKENLDATQPNEKSYYETIGSMPRREIARSLVFVYGVVTQPSMGRSVHGVVDRFAWGHPP